MFTVYGKDGEVIYDAKFDEAVIEKLDGDSIREVINTIMGSMVEREKCIQEARVKIAHQRAEASANAFSQFTGELTRLITNVAGSDVNTNVIDVSPTTE